MLSIFDAKYIGEIPMESPPLRAPNTGGGTVARWKHCYSRQLTGSDIRPIEKRIYDDL